MKTIRDLTTRLKTALTDSHHPDHREIKNQLIQLAKKLATHLPALVEVVKRTKEIEQEARSMHEVLTASASVEDWRQYIAKNPPSAGAIAWLLMIHEDHVKVENARANAHRRHAKSEEAKLFVQREWEQHQRDYRGNKSEFARHYARRVMNEHAVSVTEKTIRERWLT